MTDYTKATNFASKDSLSTGNPLKIVKGTEINTEFDNISTAIATKADLNSPTFIGTPAAPTASAGTSNTQIATTAFLATLYPVGTIYSNISNSTNPGTLFGFGTWVALEGVTVIGRSSTDSTFGTAGATGGSKDAIVVAHTHTVTDPGHVHTINYQSTLGGANYGSTTAGCATGTQTNSATTGISIDSTGSSGTNANLPPYVVAYVWKRTA
jgi:hypothetical protein